MKPQDLKTSRTLAHFQLEATPIDISPISNGLINDTYKVTTDGTGTPDYVLQRINTNIFTDVELLQHNIETVTGHIRRKLEARGEKDIDRKVLRFIKTDDGKTFHRADDGSHWRVSLFIPNAVSHEEVNARHANECGQAFGDYESMLADLDEPLGETIPRFHDMELRLQQLDEAIANDKAKRHHLVEGMVGELLADASDMCRAERLCREGKLPRRACHCDTKVNNMMFDKETGEFLLVIDLDTTMPSFVFSDYGDFLRSAANATAEDDANLDNVRLKWDIIEAFTKGYVSSAGKFLTDTERGNLPFAAALFPYMQSVRFLTDYLNGDVYWKVRYAEHNLDRARNQQRLYQLMKQAEPRIAEIAASAM